MAQCSTVGRQTCRVLRNHTLSYTLMCPLDPGLRHRKALVQLAKYSRKEGSKSSTLKYQKPQCQPSRSFHCTLGDDLCHSPVLLGALKWKVLDWTTLEHSSCYSSVLARAGEGRWRETKHSAYRALRVSSDSSHQHGRCPKGNGGRELCEPAWLQHQFLLWRHQGVLGHAGQ